VDPANGSGTPDAPVPTSQGAYHVKNHVDVSVEVFLPDQVEGVVTTLRTFSTNPGKALLELPGQAGVPAVGTLLDAVPGPLKDKLEDWINGYIDPISIGGVKLTDAAGLIAMLAETALTNVDLDSDLTIDGATATQTFTQLDLSPAGIDATLPLDVPTDLRSATTTAAVESGTLTLGDEHFGFEYGTYAWVAVNQASTSLFGADIRTTLGNAVNCGHLADTISNKCVLGVCVGHKDLIDGACEAGLDFVVDQMKDKFESINLDVVHFASGSAALVDDSGDGIADRIDQGTWDAEINGGQGLRHVPATFTGAR